MTHPVLQTFAAVALSILFCLIYFAGTNFVLDKVLALPFGQAQKRERLRSSIRPWLFLGAGLAAAGGVSFVPAHRDVSVELL